VNRFLGRRRDHLWWLWLLTALALGAHLGGWRAGLPLALALTTLQGVCFIARVGPLDAFPVEVRVAYAALLFVGSWPPLVAVHWMQLAGTTVLIVFDYCPLARLLSLLPHNRRGPLTIARLWATFFSRPVHGSILAALAAHGSEEPMAALRARRRGTKDIDLWL